MIFLCNLIRFNVKPLNLLLRPTSYFKEEESYKERKKLFIIKYINRFIFIYDHKASKIFCIDKTLQGKPNS
ncbi:hypothetical protein A7K93_06170 [Candidatus Methylacidiphilum fumarolicum]|nr:hypothetical protein A7K73_07980 [Candidatus Methylacidiphilum fumarolicum]TFE73456.1 hypothetical protein A7K93_06170 [Candidatus Methylacidiphilum fumarolicum]TFE74377.1 hypothetical protein A7K72_04330 [Candidatus Methylacidiphilum fumarolicum]TFE76935.1 hypothetical protein A7D33_07525 [Candidatus Methylacidiphilum fumarolicum]